MAKNRKTKKTKRDPKLVRAGVTRYNKPKRTPGGPKKFVVVAKVGDETRLIRFGDRNMKIKKNIPSRRKSFRARHNCKTAKDKFSARYWSCKKW